MRTDDELADLIARRKSDGVYTVTREELQRLVEISAPVRPTAQRYLLQDRNDKSDPLGQRSVKIVDRREWSQGGHGGGILVVPDVATKVLDILNGSDERKG